MTDDPWCARLYRPSTSVHNVSQSALFLVLGLVFHTCWKSVSKCWNVFWIYVSELRDRVGSDLPITWSPEPYKELVRGGVQTYSTSSPHDCKICKLQGIPRFHSNSTESACVAACASRVDWSNHRANAWCLVQTTNLTIVSKTKSRIHSLPKNP